MHGWSQPSQIQNRAALNLNSGLVAALPDTTQSGWLGRKTLSPAGGLYVVCPNTKILGGDAGKDGTDWVQMLTGEEIGKLVATWTAQAVLLGLRLEK